MTCFGHQSGEGESGVNIAEGVGGGLLIDLNELQVLGVGNNIGLREFGHRYRVINFQQPLVGQQFDAAAVIRGIHG